MNTKAVLGQEAMLNKQVRKIITIIGVGIILLISSYIAIFLSSSAYNKQIDVILALNKYRLGSKALTYAVQSYAVSGDEQYYNDYMDELNVNQNRDKAIEILEKNGLTEKEWVMLEKIYIMYRRLRDLREDKDMNQTQVAKMLGMSQTGYSKYETGENDIPTAILIKLARFYDTSIDYLLGETENSERYR